MCKVKGCKCKATKTWAMAPVCEKHYKAIFTEVRCFYARRYLRSECELLNDIYPLTIWGRKAKRSGGNWQ